MHFSLVSIIPPLQFQFHAFDDIVIPLFFALKRLNFDVEILINKTNPHSQNIIFGSFIIAKDSENFIPKNSIIYNLEQIVPNSFLDLPQYMAHLQKYTVWDYNKSNVQSLAEKKVFATHAQIGYVPEMSRLNLRKNPNIDVLFYGAVDSPRKPILERIKDANVRLHTAKAFGTKRDMLIADSKAVINIHSYFHPPRLEEVRLSYLWANKVPVISETCLDTAIPEHLKDACLYTTYDRLVEETKSFISDDKKLEQQGKAGFLAFSSMPFENTMKSLVGQKIYATAGGSPDTGERNFINHPCLLTPPKLSWFNKKKRSLKKSFQKRRVSFKKKINALKYRLFVTKKALVPSSTQSVYNGNGPTEWLLTKDFTQQNDL